MFIFDNHKYKTQDQNYCLELDAIFSKCKMSILTKQNQENAKSKRHKIETIFKVLK